MLMDASAPSSECTGCRQQGHVGCKALQQQNPPVLNWECRPNYNGIETIRIVEENSSIFILVGMR